ncbi:low temperature requirement protein A [Streptomyces polychromogenes]|nr:low temperature requirement protein A [Streptomyces polychromogenes]
MPACPRTRGPVGTPLELFFGLVFLFAITQVTDLMAADPTVGKVARGVLMLGVLWWCWTVTIPEAFDDAPGGLHGPTVFAFCYLAVRLVIPTLITATAQLPISRPIVAAVLLGLAVSGALGWAYFDVTALLTASQGSTGTNSPTRSTAFRVGFETHHRQPLRWPTRTARSARSAAASSSNGPPAREPATPAGRRLPSRRDAARARQAFPGRERTGVSDVMTAKTDAAPPQCVSSRCRA